MRWRPIRAGVLWGVLLCVLYSALTPSVSQAQSESEFRGYDPTLHWSLAGGIVGVWLGAETAARLGDWTHDCRVCNEGADGDYRFLGVDDAARNALLADDPVLVSALSDVLVIALPIAGAGLVLYQGYGEVGGRYLEDLPIILQSVAGGMLLAFITKHSVARRRPWASVLPRDERDALDDDEANTAFVSGHTTMAFSAVVSTGMVATYRGYSSAPYIWGVGLPLAAGVGLMRIASDRHFLTDVLGGVLVGTAAGLFFPWVGQRTKGSFMGGVSVNVSIASPTTLQVSGEF